jgi:hypothetical protein
MTQQSTLFFVFFVTTSSHSQVIQTPSTAERNEATVTPSNSLGLPALMLAVADNGKW